MARPEEQEASDGSVEDNNRMATPRDTHTPVERVDVGSVSDEVLTEAETEAAARIQRLVRCRNARRQLRALLAAVFEKYYDESSGAYNYHNKRTGETTWEKPRALGQHDDLALASAYGEGRGGEERAPSFSEKDDGTKVVDLDADADQSPENGEGSDYEAASGEQEEGGAHPSGFSSREVELLRAQFGHYDSDKSGAISAKELQQLLAALGEPATLANAQELIRQVDADNSGQVEFDEFLQLLGRQRRKNRYSAPLDLAVLVFSATELENLKRQFMRLDLDGSGSIDEHELAALVKKLGRKAEEFDLRAMLREVDADGSGSIGFGEFLQIVAAMTKNKDGGASKSAFASLLELGIAQGILDGLDEVLRASRQRAFEWWNADMIAEQKRLEIKRQRRRQQEEQRRKQLEADRQMYAAHQARLAEVEAARKAHVDGLSIEVEFAGDGVTFPTVGQYARVHYEDTFASSGQVFESTRRRPGAKGAALEFCVGAGHLIKGFDLALRRMSVGETARVTVAPALAYGVRGRPPKIPPNAALVFKIKLIAVKVKLNRVLDFDDAGDE